MARREGDLIDLENNEAELSPVEQAQKANDIYNLANAAWLGAKFPAAGAVFAFTAMFLNQMGKNSSNKACDYAAPETYLIPVVAALVATMAYASLATIFYGIIAKPIRNKADLSKLNEEQQQKFAALIKPNNNQIAGVFFKTLFAGTLSFASFGIAADIAKCESITHPELQNVGVKLGLDTAIAGGTTMMFLVLNMLTKLKIPRSQYAQVFVALLTSFEVEGLAENLASSMGISDPAITAATAGTIKFAFAGLAGAAAGLIINAPPIRECFGNALSCTNFFSNAKAAKGYQRIPNREPFETFQPDPNAAKTHTNASEDTRATDEDTDAAATYLADSIREAKY